MTTTRVRYRFQRRGSRLMAWFLARDRPASANRRTALYALFAILWLGGLLVEAPDVSGAVSIALRPLGVAPGGYTDGLLTLVFRLFHPHLWRHVLLAGLGTILAVTGAARYLDDIFELQDVYVALRYLQASVFGGRYHWIEIKDGDVTEASKRSPAYLIGGPGFAKVHLGNAAVFEQVGGRTVVVGATPAHFLHGFERLREVVDLQNQHRSLPEVEAYTKDGIPVKGIDIHAEFRVCPGQSAQGARNPYPVNPLVVRRLVYGKEVGKDSNHSGPGAWSQAVAGRIGGQVRRYLETHLLDELIHPQERPVAGDSEPLAEGLPPPLARASESEAAPNPREPLSLSFYEPEIARRFEEMGVEVLWVGIGTLGTPPEVAKAHISEWVSRWQAEVRSSEAALEAEQMRGRGVMLARFVSLVGGWARKQRNQENGWRPVEILAHYQRVLSRLFKAANESGQLAPGAGDALDYLQKLAGPRIIGGE